MASAPACADASGTNVKPIAGNTMRRRTCEVSITVATPTTLTPRNKAICKPSDCEDRRKDKSAVKHKPDHHADHIGYKNSLEKWHNQREREPGQPVNDRGRAADQDKARNLSEEFHSQP